MEITQEQITKVVNKAALDASDRFEEVTGESLTTREYQALEGKLREFFQGL